MKKQILYFSLAALALAACSEQADFTQADIANAAIEKANAGDVPVAFGTYVGTGGTTRAGQVGEITTNNILKGIDNTSAGDDHKVAGFGVFAYNTNALKWSERDGTSGKEKVIPNFMYNEKVYWDATGTGAWKYGVIKYWPNGKDAANAANSPSNSATQSGIQYLSFFAYAPYTIVTPSSGAETTGGDQQGTADVGITALTANTVAGDPIVSYSLPEEKPTGENVVDLLWGLSGTTAYSETDNDASLNGPRGTGYNVDLTKQTTTERVNFLFKHALAKIADIKVVYDIDGNGSGLTGFGSNDDNTLVTIKTVSIDPSGNAQFYKTGKFDIANGTWDKTSATCYDDATSLLSGSETINPDIAEPAAASSPQYASDEWKKHDKSTRLPGVKVTATSLYSNYQPIMLIPAPEHTPELTVAVTYVVRTHDEKLNQGANDDTNSDDRKWSKVTQTITNNVTLPQLAVNTKYTLVMHLGMTSVKFSAEVADWDEGAVKEVWLPSNVVANNTSAEVAASATSHVFDFSAYSATLGGSLSASASGTGINGDVTISGSGTSATIGLTANTTSSKVVNTVTIQGDKGKVVLTLTQNAADITISDLSAGKVEVSGPDDLSLSETVITIKKANETVAYNSTGATVSEYTYSNNDSGKKTITMPTGAGTYTVTVTQNDATQTKDITVTDP